ncbi:DUF1726 domain-containing protein [Edwardsiella ictaluri]|nr:tRNA(Met) cytidine acetyltransferase TmcA domain-containing protein [Edwardsiella ictaluri]WFO10311.1 DUF1726 domain-containing protein [Edwardsiella ictaluri]
MPLSVSLPAMSRAGVRRLLVISGEADWCRRRAALAIAPLGDVTWCGSPAPTGCQMLSLAQIRTVLGRELGHCVLDWHPGCHAEVLAALAGTLRAGSWLILLTPPWSAWAKRPDDDSLRWSEREHPIATANFVHHLQRTLSDADGVTLWRRGGVPGANAAGVFGVAGTGWRADGAAAGDTARTAYAGRRQCGAGSPRAWQVNPERHAGRRAAR